MLHIGRPDRSRRRCGPESAADLRPAHPAWRQRAYQAADVADDETLKTLIVEIQVEQALAAQLAELVADFRFHQLKDLTGISR